MRRVLLAAVIAAGAVGILAQEASAFHHVIRTRCIAYYPGLYSFGYCGAPCPPPYTFPCTYSYPKYCGPFASCYDGRVYCSTGQRHCGRKHTYSGCGYGGGLGYGCCFRGCFGLRGCAPRGYWSDSCGSSCGGCEYGGCGDGGCSTGTGCQNCEAGTSASVGAEPSSDAGSSERSYQVDEKVLYDGPADKAPAPRTPPMPQEDPSAGRIFQRPFRLASNVAQQQRDGSNDFNRGLRAFWDNDMTAALEAFEVATAAEPQNPLYAYYRALSMYNLHGADAANDWLAQAVQLERSAPISQWGRRMERVQGRARIWVEQARAAGGIGA